jgi:hypothetical protein
MGYISQMDADNAILPVVYYVFAVLSSSIEHDDRALNIDSARDVKAARRVQLHVSVTRERHDQSMPWCWSVACCVRWIRLRGDAGSAVDMNHDLSYNLRMRSSCM